MKIFYCDGSPLPLPPGHRFPIQKYVLLREAVLAADLVAPENLLVPKPATDEQILRAHDDDFAFSHRGGAVCQYLEVAVPFTCVLNLNHVANLFCNFFANSDPAKQIVK